MKIEMGFKMNSLFSCNNDPYNLKSIIISELNQVHALLKQAKIEESIVFLRDIVLILRSLKQNQRMVKLNNINNNNCCIRYLGQHVVDNVVQFDVSEKGILQYDINANGFS